MENVIQTKRCVTDFKILKSEECEKGAKLIIYSDIDELLVYKSRNEPMDDVTIFGISVEFGEKTIMMDISINELELFARSLLSHIKMIRKVYGEEIKMQNNMGCQV